jgi:hypothetical protein
MKRIITRSTAARTHTRLPPLPLDHVFKGVGKSIAITVLDMWELNPISRCARLWSVF